MIQRIQTVYLLLGSISVAAPLYIRVWLLHTDAVNPMVDVIVQIVAGLTAATALAVIFLHSDRSKQYRLTLVIQVLTLLVIVAMLSVLYLSGNLPGVSTTPVVSATFAVVLLPFLAYVFFFLARRAINKDIQLVKSMDRLR
ncbi:MAG: DUF4293 family protein [Rhodothermales bacterium]|nr:DUF4293 family protein [Rhodothermales bacterium]